MASIHTWSAGHESARRAMRKRLLALGDEELQSLYYSAVTLAEHDAKRRGYLEGMEEAASIAITTLDGRGFWPHGQNTASAIRKRAAIAAATE